MHEPLWKLETVLVKDAVVPTDETQQVLRLSTEDRSGWADEGEVVVEAAKELGVTECGHGMAHRDMDKKLDKLQPVADHMGGAIRMRGSLGAAILYGRWLYGSACHNITERQLRNMPGLASASCWRAGRVGATSRPRRPATG